jgi:PIN domain nuclease of toxin-antitoxin system
MRVLLDTHVLLWVLVAPEKLHPSARAIVEDTENDVMFSAASIWEIAIKFALKRDDFAIAPEKILMAARESGFVELPVGARAAAHVANLPPHHRDPFDRILVAQAVTEPAILYTADAQLQMYSDMVQRV